MSKPDDSITKEVGTSSPIDPGAILAALGVTRAETITPVLGGQDAALFRVELEVDTFALRVFRPGDEAASAREVMVMRAVGEAGIAVPKVHAAGVWQRRPALLLEWRPGRTIAEAAIAEPERAEPLGVAAGRVLARLHAVEPPDAISDRSWLDWFAIPDALGRALVAAAGPARLLHLDYHPLNLLADGDDITAVLDWANARSGDPRADLARSIAILRLGVDEALVDVGPVVSAFERGLIDGYVESAGPLVEMPVFLAWAGHGMLHDLAQRLTPEKRARILAWTAEREREAGVT